MITIKSKSMKTEFVQKKKVGVAGSFINQMMGNNSSLPEVGKGATILKYSDREVAEVVEVSADYKTVKMERLSTSWDNTLPGGCGHQNWKHEPTGSFFELHWRNGAWRRKFIEIVWVDEFYKKFIDTDRNFRVTHSELWDENGMFQVVPGKSRQKVNWIKTEVLFGVKDYYYDWSF